MRYFLALCLGAVLILGASSIPMEVIKALAAPGPTPRAKTPVPPPSAGGGGRAKKPQQHSGKSFMKRIYKKKVLNVPSKGMQIVLLPWKCYNQSSCQQKPKCAASSAAGGKTVCAIKCYACKSCVQPKIVRKKLKSGKIKETRKSYIRTHRCGMCVSKSVCTAAPCQAPAACTLSKG